MSLLVDKLTLSLSFSFLRRGHPRWTLDLTGFGKFEGQTLGFIL